jgi:hypothetical protein
MNGTTITRPLDFPAQGNLYQASEPTHVAATGNLVAAFVHASPRLFTLRVMNWVVLDPLCILAQSKQIGSLTDLTSRRDWSTISAAVSCKFLQPPFPLG